jgi:hypothetical protein
MTIFFVWSGDREKVQLLGRFGGDVHSNGYGTLTFGVLTQVRNIHAELNKHSNKIAVLPGPNGVLTQDQATAILPAFPNAAAGMPMKDILAALYAATGVEAYNINNY